VIWPAALIAFGLTVLVRNSRRGDHLVLGEGHDQDLVRTTAFLSGSELATQSNAFRGAVLTAIMGGVELDMRHATLAADGAEVDATAIMGGVDLIIPRDWRVTVRGTPILGGVSNLAEGSSLPDDAPRLRVDALAILGGVEIKHDK
jgi:predicted membrane protein